MSKRVYTFLMLVLFTFASSSVYGSSQLGYGNTKCSIFNAIQDEGGAMTQGIDSWALGFLSGLNQASAAAGEPDMLRTQQPERVAGYIRAFCSSNANETVMSAVYKLWQSAKTE